jgi:3-oxoacyl-[acyl-carrier-protein] synthase-3
VLGTGIALPGPAIDTGDTLDRVERNFNVAIKRLGIKLAARLGIRQRHFARDFAAVGEVPRPGDTNPDLAARALADAAHRAGLHINDLGYIISHTTSPHTPLPSNAAWVADRLGYTGPYAELRQACAGFAHAVQLGVGLMHAPTDAPIAIVGSETGSVFLDPRQCESDIGQLINLVQMGDGAGAIILGPISDDSRRPLRPTITSPFVGSLGPGLPPGFWMEGGGSASPKPLGVLRFHHDFAGVRSRGPDLFRHALAAAAGAGVDLTRIGRFLPHQANAIELPEQLARTLGVPTDRMIVDCDTVGNLGSASIWVALHRFAASQRTAPGEQTLVLGAEATKYLFGGFVYEHA